MQFRHFRNQIMHTLGIERCYKPRVMIDRPEVSACDFLEWAIASHVIDNPQFQFIQIGAFDGSSRDPLYRAIRRHNLNGVLVEPQKPAFERLQQTCADQPQLQLVNAAVAPEQGTRTMYMVKGGASLLASFDRKHLLKHRVSPTDIIEEPVQCITIDDLLEMTGGRADLLQIDAEGFDFDILQSLDLETLKPSLIRYEQLHMSRRQRNIIGQRLADIGYRLNTDRIDAMGCLERAA